MLDDVSELSYRCAVARSLSRCFSPWTRMPPEEWATEIYRLPGGQRFKWEYAPYARAIFRSYFDRQTIETILEIFSRGLKSTTTLLLIGYVIDQAPRRVLALWPTNQQAEKWSKDVLTGELFDTTDCLAYLGSSCKKRDGSNTLLHKIFPGGLIDMFGANAPGDMRRAKGSLLVADEIDAIDTTQTDEGDQLEIFWKRGAEYPDTIRVSASYPSLRGHSRIDARMAESDGNQWFVTCVLCGKEPFVMHRKQLRYDPARPHEARLECPRCKGLLTDPQRYDMAHRQGFDNWKPQREFRGKRGFHANAMLWPHPVDPVKYPGGFLQMVAQQEIDAEKSDNPARARRVMINTVDAEVYDPDTSTEVPPEWEVLLQKRENYATEPTENAPVSKIVLPKGALWMSAGGDIQSDRVEVTKVVWGKGEEAWTAEHVVIPGDPKTTALWENVEKELLREYDHESGVKIGLSFALFDCGYGAEHLLWFFGQLKQKASPLHGRIRACRGWPGYPHPVVDFKFSRLSKQLRGHWVGGDEAKDLLYSRLKMPQEGPGYQHHGMNFSERNMKQLCSEKVTVGFERGQETRRFKNTDHVRNEELDCRVYSFAAYRLRRPNFDAIQKEIEARAKAAKDSPEEAAPEPPPMPKRNPFTGGMRWQI